MPVPLSIVIPAYNEHNRIPKALKRLGAWQPAEFHPIQIVVVDDGSTDDTREIVQNYRAQDPRLELVPVPHGGAMQALLAGVKHSRYDLIGSLEADLASDPDEFLRLLPSLNQADIAMGSRLLRGNLPPIEGKSFFRRVLSTVLSSLFGILFRSGIKDPQIGFKLYKKSVLDSVLPTLTLQHDGMKNTEIVVRAYAQGFQIREVPVIYRHDEDSRTVTGWALKIVWDAQSALFQIWVTMAKEYRQGKLRRPVARAPLIAQMVEVFLR